MKIKKIILWLLLPLLSLGLFGGLIVYKGLNNYKPKIYNYQSYINPEFIPVIEKKYSYREYKNNSEFNVAIDNNKAIAGISTDYMIIDLINSKKLAKIDFKNAFGIEDPKIFYTDATIKQLDFFDKYIDGDIDGDGQNDSFWEFIIPVWLNNKVFVYNSSKINDSNIDFKNDYSHINILKQLTENGVNGISWTNAPIENSVIGSEINNGKFDTKIDLNNYKQRIEQFSEIVRTGTGHEMNNGKFNIFEDDSDVVLQNVIDPNSFIEASYLFNGDALDAYWSSDNFTNVEDGTIKLVKPENSPSFIDGFVISSSISKQKQIELLVDMNDVFFRGKFMTKLEIEEELVDGDKIDWEGIPSIYNFDYVNYTPTSKGEYEFILENYFSDENDPEVVKSFYSLDMKQIFPISPLTKELQSKISAEFKRKLRQ
ncbi:MAG: hypothetical protein KFW07_03495 [Mycoplasmataceae bacterium]|nr:hypothetical protein [Mycoplasmataceae bacterium]